MHFLKTIGALALVTLSAAQNVTYCADSEKVCYAVNVLAATASSGSGDIYMQISGPSTMSWIGLGQGSSMKGANIFMIYADAAGTNVTLSPRLGTGNNAPDVDTTTDVTLLSGSGITNGIMTANIRCSNCNSWTGGSMSLTSSSSDWIWAYKTGSAVSSDSVSASLAMHSSYGTTTFNLQDAAGGSNSNPFGTTSAAAASSSSSSSSSSSDDGDSSSSDSTSSSAGQSSNTILMAHAILGPIAFVLFYPVGAIAIRVMSFPGLLWLHAGWMVFTYILVLVSMGLGIQIAITTQQLDTTHSIIGLVVVGCLLIQPISGLIHHLLYKRVGRPNAATYPHVWWGRAVITLGIINGGLGLQLVANTTTGEIAYGIVAGFMWLLWMLVIILAFLKSRSTTKGESGDSFFGEKRRTDSDENSMRRIHSQHRQSPADSSPSDSFVEEGQGYQGRVVNGVVYK